MYSESLCTQNDKAKDLTATLRGSVPAHGTTPTELDDHYQERLKTRLLRAATHSIAMCVSWNPTQHSALPLLLNTFV